MTQEEFFEGFSIPRNKELMRVFKDLDLVEHLGSGVLRILKSYGKECFIFSENFTRMIFPSAAPVTDQVKQLLSILSHTLGTNELMAILELKHKPTFRTTYIKPALELGLIEMTIPDKPNSRFQKYKLTLLGKRHQITDI